MMSNPLDAHPELSALIHAPGVVEFRVENWKLRRGVRVPRGGLGLGDLIYGLCSTWASYKFGFPTSTAHLCFVLSVVALYLYFKCTRLLYESILIIPQHGIQLETHRGVKLPFIRALPLSSSRRFIPLTSIRDVVINEGLRRWDVRYYICIIQETGPEVALDVAFENILPHLPVLQFIYNEIQDMLRKP